MIYATADLHGCDPRDFQRLLDRAGFDMDDFLFILGDVIDRGPWGAELLLWLTQQPNMQLILGNHEAQLLCCSFLFEEVSQQSLDALSVEQLSLVQNWIDNGGSPTLKGFQKLLKKDPDTVYGILDYLQDAPLFETLEVKGQKFILVHSGLGNFHTQRSLDDYTPEELLFQRPTTDTQYYSNARVIFGHTPTHVYGVPGKAVHTGSWTCIDTGAALGDHPMLLRLDDMQEFYL